MIELKNVSFAYSCGQEGEGELSGSLKDLSLTVNDGEFVLLTGGSGCGKTTILRLINGLIPNFFEGRLQGSVLVNGKDISSQELYETAKAVSTVFQNPCSQFFNVDTASELAFACENQGLPEEEILKRIKTTVSELKLEPLMNKSLFNLSGGQKQKIACASVAVTGNSIILLDEPSANLDLQSIDELGTLLKKWKDEGKTVVVAEHRISYLWNLADRTIVLEEGKIKKELSRSDMDCITEDELYAMGLRSNKADILLQKKSGLNAEARSSDVSGNSLVIQDFSYKYRYGYLALNIPHMEIEEGKVTAVTGNNGDGKTTFLNTLCGLGHRAKGILSYKGKQYKRKKRQKLIFLVMQDVNHQLFTESVLDEVLISQPEENEQEALAILESLNLEAFADRHPQSLSGGQKQRVAVACAIASGRDILLFDEPTSGLDFMHMKQIGKILRDLKQMGKTVLVVTHDRELIRECCDREICLKDYNQI
ncbi:MAG: ABC transporter ATP-binding protein [Treponema sp.]|nr:ABC transporter ATP-binding protein [Treponema sp.]